MILKVAKLGVKTLRAISKPVDPRDVAHGSYEPFLTDLEDTMREYDGTGIAAPQVFTSLRISLRGPSGEAQALGEGGLVDRALQRLLPGSR